MCVPLFASQIKKNHFHFFQRFAKLIHSLDMKYFTLIGVVKVTVTLLICHVCLGHCLSNTGVKAWYVLC